MTSRAPSSEGSAQVGGPAQPTTKETLVEVERLLLAKRPWPAFLLVGFDAVDEWGSCPEAAKDALQWIATSTVGVLDIASVGPLTLICQAFKALIEAAYGVVEVDVKLRELISWCAFIIGVFIKLGKTGGALSEAPVHKCMQEFNSTSNRLAKYAQTMANRGKLIALLSHRKHSAELACFETDLHKIWADMGVLATFDVREMQRGLLPPKQGPMADVPIEAPSLPDSHVDRSCLMEEVTRALTDSSAGNRPHILIGMGGGGKTVLASSVVRNENIRKHFRQGIFWLDIGQGGKGKLHARLKGLAKDMAAERTDIPHGIPSHGFKNLDAVVQHLAAVARSDLPRLVVLDDVWEREVVDTMLTTGLVLLVTSRDESVVGVPGRTRTDVGDMMDDEASMLLRRVSMTVGSPGADVEEAINQVARDCGFLPLALAIAGSMPAIKGRGASALAWKQLHRDLENRGDMLLSKGETHTSIHRVLDASFDFLGTRKQTLFLKMAVLPKGAVAPEGMLQNLWEAQDSQETRDEARSLMGRSLLQAVGSGGYRMHDLLLDFARDRIKPTPLALTVKCQAQYLARLDVVREYAGDGHHNEGFYALMSLWRSVEELSDNPRVQADEYRNGLQVLAEDDSTDTGYVHWALGRLFELQSKYSEAEPLYRRAIDIREKTLGSDHPSVAVSLNTLANLLRAQAKYADAEALVIRAIGIEEKALGPDHYGMANTLHNLARLLQAQGKYAEAEAIYNRTLGIQKKTLGPDCDEVATTLHNLAGLLTAQGKYTQAEALYIRAIGLAETVLGLFHRDVAPILHNMARLLQTQRKYAEAEAYFIRAIDVKEKALGHDHHEVAKTLVDLAGLVQEQGNDAEAEALSSRAVVIMEAALGPEHHFVGITLQHLAGLLQAQGKHTEAEDIYTRAIGILEKALGPDHHEVVTTLNNMAFNAWEQGKSIEATKILERTLEIQTRKLGAEHRQTVDSKRTLELARNHVR